MASCQLSTLICIATTNTSRIFLPSPGLISVALLSNSEPRVPPWNMQIAFIHDPEEMRWLFNSGDIIIPFAEHSNCAHMQMETFYTIFLLGKEKISNYSHVFVFVDIALQGAVCLGGDDGLDTREWMWMCVHVNGGEIGATPTKHELWIPFHDTFAFDLLVRNRERKSGKLIRWISI